LAQALCRYEAKVHLFPPKSVHHSMALSLPVLSIFALLATAASQWACPAGWKGRSGSPACAGVDGTTCSDANCCLMDGHICSEYSAAYAISQLVGAGCAADGKFFDLKKAITVVGGTQMDSDIKAACCTPYADATCADWVTMTCSGNGKYKVMTTSAPGDSSGQISNFQSQCCADRAKCSAHTCSAGTKKSNAASISCIGDAASCTDLTCCNAPITCASYSAAWIISAALGGGCAQDSRFFDLKKLSATVGGSQSEADVKAACCTAFADATCQDWNLKSCPSGKFRDNTAAAPADGPSSGTKTTLSNDKFKELCCKDPMKCADYVAETDAALLPAFPLVATVASLVGLSLC